MPEPIVWLVMLLPVAAASGWWARSRAEQKQARSVHAPDTAVPSDYLLGIRYLVNDDADRAIETFSRALAVDDDTAETHLALGNLFRRQGDIDRALRIHQNLIARPDLAADHRDQARFELARDYLRAGVLDRAETLFNELSRQGRHADRSLSGLLSIHEQTREWAQAVAVAERLARVRGRPLNTVVAQYHCEQAIELRAAGYQEAAAANLTRAARACAQCARARLIEGGWREEAGDYRGAIRCYRQILKSDPDFAPEIIAPVVRCFEALAEPEGLQRFLDRFIERVSVPAAHVAKARALSAVGRTDEAIAYLSRYLQCETNWLGFHCLLELSAADPRTRLTGPLDNLRQALGHIVARTPTHACEHCGFASRYLHWQCPSCRQWVRMKPLSDIRPDRA